MKYFLEQNWIPLSIIVLLLLSVLVNSYRYTHEPSLTIDRDRGVICYVFPEGVSCVYDPTAQPADPEKSESAVVRSNP